ncbi:MAG: ornithine--oxo-acid transaminase [Propionibacteriaceae bacterium]|nr:ornithine--oxo-acid transaminase [Propionibacteriaceae bacterium]
MAAEEEHLARNYYPLPVVIASGVGVWVTDVEGRRYLDALAAYSALNFGHRPPRLIEAAKRQLDTLTLSSRAFHSAPLGPFVAELAALAGKEAVLPMNTGVEAVESGIKIARRWAYEVKGVPYGTAEIIVASRNFHGRTTTVISFSDDELAHRGYAPFMPGFIRVPYDDADAIAAAITPRTAAVLVEPIQGEAGVYVPAPDYLPRVRQLTREANVLFIADEIQSGLGRTGATFECDNAGVVPDMYLLGKALGGGVVPVSAVVADWDVMGVLTPGSHGSTFGGNPLAAAVGVEVVRMLSTGEYQRRARDLGARMHDGLRRLVGSGLTAVRGRGLWAGIDIDPALGTGRDVCLRLLAGGVLAKDTHGQTIRLAPPLVITADEVDWLLDRFAAALG